MEDKITYRQAKLLRMMAWNERQQREPSENDKKLVPIAIRMLTYVACLNYAVCDFETELKMSGKFRHEVKRRFQMVQKLISDVHARAYYMLYNSSKLAGRQYNDQLDETWEEIDSSVLLKAPERSYNILVALCRLVEQLNIKLTGKYDFAPARVLYRIPGMLSCCGIEDRHIDQVIDMNVS